MAELGLSSALVLSGGCCWDWLCPQASHTVMQQWVAADAVWPGRGQQHVDARMISLSGCSLLARESTGPLTPA